MTNVASIAPTQATPLANIEAELSLLGSLLYDNRLVHSLAHLHPDHFYDELLRDAYAAALDLIERGDNANPISVVEHMGGERVLLRHLADAVADAHTPAAKTDADIIVNAARLRHAVGVAD